jgi:hypothetical protein
LATTVATGTTVLARCSDTRKTFYPYGMNSEEFLSRFNLLTHGDRHEREFWPLLSVRFPSYETLWRRLVVPLTGRVDPKISPALPEWIRLRSNVPRLYEQIAMAHYSVFYFAGRAVMRLSEDRDESICPPEDVFFLLNAAIENLKTFLERMIDFGKDLGHQIFEQSFSRFPKGFAPFEEIEAYRNALLHNAVMGRAVGVEKTFLPKWNPDIGI